MHPNFHQWSYFLQPVLELEELWGPSGAALHWSQAERGRVAQPGGERLWAPQAAVLQVPMDWHRNPSFCLLPPPRTFWKVPGQARATAEVSSSPGATSHHPCPPAQTRWQFILPLVIPRAGSRCCCSFLHTAKAASPKQSFHHIREGSEYQEWPPRHPSSQLKGIIKKKGICL